MQATVFLSLLAFASASPLNILKVRSEDSQVESTDDFKVEDLTIKMPDAIAAGEDKLESEENLLEKQEEDLSEQSLLEVSKVETKKTESSLSHMLENGVIHSELKPIVQNKVKKVMNFLEVIKMQYDSGDTAQKKEFLKMAETLIMQNSGVRSFNPELCNALWGESHEAAAQLSSYFCPPITYPAGAMSTARGGDVTGTPALKTLQIEPPSRQRSAYLSQYFWNFMLSRKSREVVDMLSDDVCYSQGNQKTCGKEKVKAQLPYIGFPYDSSMSSPEQWHCDKNSCITPIRAWAQQQNYCLTKWDAHGKLTEVIVPLDLWR